MLDLFDEIESEEESSTICAHCLQSFRRDQMEMEVHTLNYCVLLSDEPHCWLCAGDLRDQHEREKVKTSD